MKIIKNTYPVHPGIAHAELGDIVHWECGRAEMRLIRESDGATLFCTAILNRDGLKANGEPPVLMGIIGQVKSKGWILEIGR